MSNQNQEAFDGAVGGGSSGLAAAIEAARYGREVPLLEKNPQLGGTTGFDSYLYSGRSVPRAFGTYRRRAAC